MSFINKFVAYGKVVFKSSMAYRLQFMASIIISPLILIMYYFIWSAIYTNNSSGQILGYSFNSMITYYVLSMIVGHFIFNMVGNDLQEKIIYGDLIQDLLKPLSVFQQFLSMTVADRLFAFLVEVVPVFIISVLIFKIKIISIMSFSFFLLSMVFALLLNFLVNFMIGLVAFWVNRIEAIQWLLFIFIRFLSGEFIPLEFLGSFLFAASKYLPFYYIRYGVIQQFLGVWSFQESVFFVGLQLFWVIILYILIAAIWRIALKRFGAQGG